MKINFFYYGFYLTMEAPIELVIYLPWRMAQIREEMECLINSFLKNYDLTEDTLSDSLHEAIDDRVNRMSYTHRLQLIGEYGLNEAVSEYLGEYGQFGGEVDACLCYFILRKYLGCISLEDLLRCQGNEFEYRLCPSD